MAELVGGAILDAFINKLFERVSSAEFMNHLVTQRVDRKLLRSLETYLTTINAILFDAEYRQVALKDESVKGFLDNIRDVAYEADDLLDLIAYEVTAIEIQSDQRTIAGNSPCNLSSLRNLLSKKFNMQVRIPWNVSKKIEEIVETLEMLVKQIEPLGLKKNHIKNALPQREPALSIIDESEIFGRDSEVDALLNSLKAADKNGIGVIPIVGMGGIGKTTLAGLVYNHVQAKELFATRAWVCVSDNYDSLRIKKELLQQVNIVIEETKQKLNLDELSPQQIEDALKKSLAGKKYLIVLDDVWDNQYDNWNKLKATLKSGAPGSKILVTTRNKDIASMTGTVGELSFSELKLLNDNSCWQIFVKHAFNSGEEEENKQSFKEKVVSKCGGLPLAAKMLGGVMRGKQMEEWNGILRSEMWEINCGVIPSLMLSYQYLPSHLKQCFAYCAIFPHDYKIKKEELIQLWTAECFVAKSRSGGYNIVELGEKYVKELVSRCFLQEHNDKNDGSYFLMHDLINDLAQHISGEFLVNIDADHSCKFSTRNRYLSFRISKENSTNMVGNIREAQFLRTFWCFGEEFVSYKEAKKIVDEVVNDLLCLRVLNLRYFYVHKLPKSIKHLKHLRYLNLTETNVEKLPKAVCSLYHLETLILHRCHSLVELPENIGNLIHLHSLDIRKTTSLRKMPPSMGNLKDLQTLCKFIVGKPGDITIDELQKLQHLRGKLRIMNLKNVSDIQEYCLKNKKHLEYLTLEWAGWWTRRVVHSEYEEIVLERLQPCASINKISILDYGGKRLPNWIGDSSYTNIVSLKLDGCQYITHLPEFDKLSSLEELSILNCDAVVKISMTKPLCSLKTLLIRKMKKWEEWCFCEENDFRSCGVLEKLEKLTIDVCTKLNVISSSGMIFCILKNLKIEGCSKLKSFPREDLSDSLESLEIKYCNDQLIGGWCREVGLETFNSLSYLHLNDYSGGNLDCFPFPPNLTSLDISHFRELKLLKCKDLQQLTQLSICFCDNLESLVEDGLALPWLPKLHSLEIWRCDKLIGRRLQWGLHRFNALSHLQLGCYEGDDLNCFPEESLLPSSLASLTISHFENLEEINYRGIQHLTSLSHLEIKYCSKLRCLPEQGLLSSLSFLNIERCPLLRDR